MAVAVRDPMFSTVFSLIPINKVTSLRKVLLSGVVAVGLAAMPVLGFGQQDQTQPSSTSQAAPQQNPNQQEAPPEAGGPKGDSGPYAMPKKGEEPPPPPPPERPKKIEGMPDYSIHVDVPLVTVPVMVTSKDGQFISNLKQENFRIFEDGTPQTISDFRVEEAPITAVLLVEFASTNYPLMYDTLQASYIFASTLKKEDYVAVISYDMKPDILVDFTQDKNAIQGALNSLRIPGFAETNPFDALYDTLDRLDRIDGHKYVVLVSTGLDTFSKLRLSQILDKVKK